MWNVFVLALGSLLGSEIAEVFFSDTGFVLAEVASLMPAMGSTVAYDRAAIVERKRGRVEARRREVEVRRAAAIVSLWGPLRQYLRGIYDSSKIPTLFSGFSYSISDR